MLLLKIRVRNKWKGKKEGKRWKKRDKEGRRGGKEGKSREKWGKR